MHPKDTRKSRYIWFLHASMMGATNSSGSGWSLKYRSISIYSGVISTRSLWLSIFLAKLNNMEVWGADIGNAYQEASTKEKINLVAGPEFEELQGHILVIHRVFYSSKRSGLRW